MQTGSTDEEKVHERLLNAAKAKCLPYLTGRKEIAPYRERIAFVLVGSVATGLCREDSDVDIALVCDDDVYCMISEGTSWAVGRPTEIRIDGTQLHYYAVTFDRIRTRLRDLDDVCLYVYSQALVLEDTHDWFTHRLSDMLPIAPAIRKQRVEGKLDMLLRRSRALTSCVEGGDLVAIAKLSLEVITLCLKTIALLDDTPFDPRKRLFKTAVAGPLGKRLANPMRQLFSELGTLGEMDSEDQVRAFGLPRRLETIASLLCDTARKQGFAVGLDKPDSRHVEN